MILKFTPEGTAFGIYGELVELSSLGRPVIRRASHVEPTEDGQWLADLSPVGGPALGPFSLRSSALRAEKEWLENHLLKGGGRKGNYENMVEAGAQAAGSVAAQAGVRDIPLRGGEEDGPGAEC